MPSAPWYLPASACRSFQNVSALIRYRANVRAVPFGQPPSYRTIGLVHRQQDVNELLVATFYDALVGLAGRLLS